MTGIDSYSTTPATNATADGGAINWSEGQPPSSVNNTARQMLADTRSSYNDLIWFQFGTGDQGSGNLAVPSVYSSGTAFTITGANVTSPYHAGRRVRAVGVSTGTIYGTISSSSYNGGNTTTTVNVTWDSGSLANETLVISLSQVPVTGTPVPNSALIGFLGGLTLSTAGGSGTFGVSAGAAANSTGVQTITLGSAFTKTTSSWTSGTGNGGIDTGSIANGTWYSVYVIWGTAVSVDVLFSLSATSPTLPTGYTLFRRIGSMLTDGSAHWTLFTQKGNEFLWSVAVNNADTTTGATTAILVTTTVPTGVNIKARLRGYASDSANSLYLVSSPLESDQIPNAVAGNITISCGSLNVALAYTVDVITDTSARIRVRATSATVPYAVITYGWIDTRGQG